MSSRLRILLLALVLAALGIPRPPAARADDLVKKAYDKGEPFGVVATLANRVRDDEQDTAVALMKEAGVQWAREEIFWDRLQPTQGGAYQWGGNGSGFYNYDGSIGRMSKAGINVLGLLDYNPAWFKSKNPPLSDWIQDWYGFVYNTVMHYGKDKGQVKYWEIWNEPNLRRYGYENGIYSVADYVQVLKTARTAAKAADPDAVIVLGGISSIYSDIATPQDYDVKTYLQLLHDADGWDAFDVLAIHPYRPGAPEAFSWRRDTAQDFEAELRTVDGLLRSFGNKPVWITEISWSTYDGPYGVTPADQAAFLQRMYVLALAHPSVQRVFWYDLRNDTSPSAAYDAPVYDPKEHEFNRGLLRRTYPLDAQRPDLRTPAFVAYRALAEILRGMTSSGPIMVGDNPSSPGTFAYRYDGGGRAAIILWRVTADTPPTFTFDCSCKDARVRQWDGKLLAVIQTEGMITVRLDYVGAPLFVEWGSDRGVGADYFAQTGHRVASVFANYWATNGGVPQFGYPITGLIVEPEFGSGRPRYIQYFERNRFEYFPEYRGSPYEVQLGRLGDELLHKSGTDWFTLPRMTDAPPDCLFFPSTGHRLCEPFRSYWEQHGGLNLYGMPLTEAYEENGMLVQYFERNKFERHADQAGTPFEIQLGLLGRLLYSQWGPWPK